MIGATNCLVNVIMMLLTGMGWALVIIFGAILTTLFVVLAIFFVAIAIEKAIAFALRGLAKRPSTHLD